MAAIHAYLCADGYVIKNPVSQKHKYYQIGLRNTEPVLLIDFQTKFERVFGIKPIITNEGRCRISNKKIFLELTKEYSFYSDHWNPPKIPKRQLPFWLRAYFDCDGWVAVTKAKDRKIGLDSINKAGIIWIQKILRNEFGINSKVSKRNNRNIYTLRICGKDDLLKYNNKIGFLHPRKKEKLNEALESYEVLIWTIPEEKSMLANFVLSKAKLRRSHHQIRICSMHKRNLTRLLDLLKKLFGINGKVFGPWTNSYGSSYFCLSLKEDDMKKLDSTLGTLRY
ncbi:MAG TPA: LAGLIDADG family homing endonuclease [Candidatus Norongarragalinales archaeon]|nr:LAGLIDADG family homing endonuclease [Candidatus Norongarragalinales archaeon]